MQEDEGIDWKVNHAKTTISFALSCSNAEVGNIEVRQNLPREAVSSAVSMRVRASFFSRCLQVNINDWNLSFIQVFNFTRLISVLILDSHTPNDLEWSRRESKLYFQMTFLTSRSFTRWFLFPQSDRFWFWIIPKIGNWFFRFLNHTALLSRQNDQYSILIVSE